MLRLHSAPRIAHDALVPLLALSLGALVPAPGHAAVGGIAGFDYYQGPQSQITRGGLVAGTASAGNLDALASVIRFDDSRIGMGTGFTLGGGVPLFGETQLRAQGTRFLGDGDFRGWRTKLGPRFAFGASKLGPSWVHEDNTVVGASDGVLAELETQATSLVGFTASAGYTSLADGTQGALGTVGANTSIVPHLVVGAEVGVAQNGLAATSEPFPGGHHGLLGGLGLANGKGLFGGSTTASNDYSFTALLTVRVPIP
jgi:hypothetical protein